MTPADVPASTAPFFVTMMPKISKQAFTCFTRARDHYCEAITDSFVYQVPFAALADEEGKFYRRHY